MEVTPPRMTFRDAQHELMDGGAAIELAGDALLARLCAHWQTAPGCALSHADAVTAWIGPGFHL